MKKLIKIASAAFVTVFLLSCSTELPPSKAVSNHVSFVLVNSTNTVIGDLASKNSRVTDNQITIKSKGRILVSAQVHITNPAGIAVRGACHLFISDGTGPMGGLTEIGRAAVWYTTDNPAYDITVPVVGYAVKEPGTYNVVVQCEQLAAVGATRAVMANMVVWQAAE